MSKDIGWILYEESKGPKPYPPKSDSWRRNDSTIFLTIASFRDKLCPVTLFNLYSKALHPERVFVGVVQQNAPEDIDCFDEYCRLMIGTNSSHPCPFKNNIRMNRVDAKLAEGPTWARALGSKMVGDEEFCMQTDSHMDFVPHWDKYMLQMWGLMENEYGVLSTYVADSEQLQYNINGDKGLNGLHEVPHLCMVTFQGAYDMIRNWGTKCARNLPRPKLTNIVWGAGLSFSKCHAERKVPYDPYTPGIFDGEEYSRGLRLWTYGYDVYTPHRVYVVHNYHVSQSDPKHSQWAYNGHGNDVQNSVHRLRTIFGLPGGEQDTQKKLTVLRSKYGRGDRRTLEQSIAFSGIDTTHAKELFNGCGNLDFVPFIEHPQGPDYVPRFDPVTLAPLDDPDPGSIYYVSPSEEVKPVVSSENKKEMRNIQNEVENNLHENSNEKETSSETKTENVAVKTMWKIDKNSKHIVLKHDADEVAGKVQGTDADTDAGHVRGSGTVSFREKVKAKILDEYALLLEVENQAESELDRTGYPETIFLLFLLLVVCCIAWIGTHRFHVGKRHKLATFFDSVKTV
eukprot:gene13039-27521_t